MLSRSLSKCTFFMYSSWFWSIMAHPKIRISADFAIEANPDKSTMTWFFVRCKIAGGSLLLMPIQSLGYMKASTSETHNTCTLGFVHASEIWFKEVLHEKNMNPVFPFLLCVFTYMYIYKYNTFLHIRRKSSKFDRFQFRLKRSKWKRHRGRKRSFAFIQKTNYLAANRFGLSKQSGKYLHYWIQLY